MLNDSMETVNIESIRAFKTLWVPNALNGSEDFLVSDKIRNIAGKSMRDFKNKLMNEPLPKTVNLPINWIITPKGIKWGKSERMDQNDSVCDKYDKEAVDAELLLKSLDGDIPIEIVEQEQMRKVRHF